MRLFNDTVSLLKNTWRINKIVWRDKKWLIIGYDLVILLSSVAPFLESGIIAILINELVKVSGGAGSETLIWVTIGLALSIFIPSILWKIENYIDLLYYMFVEEKIELLTVKKYSEIDVALYEDPKHKDLFNKISEGGNWRACNFADQQFYILKNFIEVILASSILTYINWKIFLIILLASIPELIVGMYYGKRVWSIHTSKAETRRRFWDIKSHFTNLPSLIELRLFQNTSHFYNIIKELFFGFRKEEYKNNKKNFSWQIVSVVLSQGAIIGGIVYYVFEVVSGSIQIGTLTFIMASMSQLRHSLSNLFRTMSKQYQDSLFVTDLFYFLDIKPLIKKPEKGLILEKNIAPEIVFDNVTFSYPGTQKPALKNFSLKINSGQKIALVGINGAGKTTFVKLLCRFYDPDDGKILINGKDLKDVDLESWYNIIGAVFQDYSRYHLTVKDAIAIGRTGKKTDLQKVIDAAKASEADIFIKKWEMAYEQNLGVEFTEGVEPSIGQWQKLALARTFYRDPKIMIMDEPTSSIDAGSEAKIFEKIENVSDNRTVILISHRFSTVKRLNNIIIIDSGEKIEEGNHDQLMKRNGKYAELFKIQAKSYND